MAKYLKRSATYDANAPLNADDPRIVDLENGEGVAVSLQQVLNTDSTITENVTIDNPGNEIVIESVDGADSSTLTVTPYAIDAQAGTVFIQSGSGTDFSKVTTNINFCELYSEDSGGEYTEMKVTAAGITIQKEDGPRVIAYENAISGSFETVDGKIVTVVNGIITAIDTI
jgi:hypothetical protein